MKRGGPLRRKQRLVTRTPLKAKKALAPGKPLQRSRPAAKVAAEVREAQWVWRAECVAVGLCASCGGRQTKDDWLQAHHVIYQQHIRRYVDALRLEPKPRRATLDSLLWDTRNSMALHVSCHTAHHKGARRIPGSKLEARHHEFAAMLGLAHLLERHYPGGGTWNH